MATTAVLDRPVPNRPARTGGLRDAHEVARLRVTAWRVIASEWVKFRSLRSTVVTIAIALVVIIGFGALAAGVVSGDVTRPTGPGGGGGGGAFATNPTAVSLAGMTLAQIIVGILGVLAITGEYSSGMIRATLAAVPRRLPVLWAKVLVIGVSTFVVAVPASFGAFALGQTILGTGHNTTLSDPGVLRAVFGSAVYLTAIALLGLGLGALLRHTAGAIGALFGLLMVAPGLLPLVLPKSWGDSIVPYLPSNAGESFSSVVPKTGMLSAGGGALVLMAWLVVLLGVSAVLLRRRDA
ncbi:MAG TPA: ABC transporter permease subunit [Cellulomonadaceae bacterium]|nr:ABC transporter permease subunit [Cellulomonadaceae bacterium]